MNRIISIIALSILLSCKAARKAEIRQVGKEVTHLESIPDSEKSIPVPLLSVESDQGSDQGSDSVYVCTGTRVSRTLVATVEHCVSTSERSQHFVVGKTEDHSTLASLPRPQRWKPFSSLVQSGGVAPARKVHLHKDADGSFFEHVALLDFPEDALKRFPIMGVSRIGPDHNAMTVFGLGGNDCHGRDGVIVTRDSTAGLTRGRYSRVPLDALKALIKPGLRGFFEETYPSALIAERSIVLLQESTYTCYGDSGGGYFIGTGPKDFKLVAVHKGIFAADERLYEDSSRAPIVGIPLVTKQFCEMLRTEGLSALIENCAD